MPSIPTITKGRVAMYPLVRTATRKTTVLTFGGDTEQRWICQRPVTSFNLVYTDIDGYSVGLLRDFWTSQGGASTSEFDFTIGGTTYHHLVFENDEFTLQQAKPLRFSVQFSVRQVRS